MEICDEVKLFVESVVESWTAWSFSLGWVQREWL